MDYIDLADFRRWGMDTRGWRVNTRRDYSNRLLRAARWLKRHRRIALPRASYDSLLAYLSSLPPTPSTRNGTRDALAAYYTYLNDARQRRDHPAHDLPRVREPRTVPRALDPADVKIMLAIAQARGLKWLVAVTLLLDAGPRASELCGLEWADVAEGWLTVREGKGGHGRALPIHPDTARLLVRWRGEDPSPVWVLPGRWPDRPLSYQGLYYGVRQIGQAAGLDVHPHLLRSTFATSLLDAGVDARTVQRMMGHQTLATTSRYLAARDPLAVEAVGVLPWH